MKENDKIKSLIKFIQWNINQVRNLKSTALRNNDKQGIDTFFGMEIAYMNMLSAISDAENINIPIYEMSEEYEKEECELKDKCRASDCEDIGLCLKNPWNDYMNPPEESDEDRVD